MENEKEQTHNAEVYITKDDRVGVRFLDEGKKAAITFSPDSAYRLGEAMCIQAIAILRGDINKEIDGML